jgi:hypothetical protein
MEQAKPIKIDFMGRGFNITSNMAFKEECGGCGSTSNCCS